MRGIRLRSHLAQQPSAICDQQKCRSEACPQLEALDHERM